MSSDKEQRFLIGEDADVLERFYYEFETVVFQAENLALTLEQQSENVSLVDELILNLRKLNSLALNTNVVPLIEPFNVLDSFISAVRDRFQPEISYPLMLLLDRALLAAKEAVDQYSISMQLITDIQRSIQPLARFNAGDDIGPIIEQVVNLLLGDYIENPDANTSEEIELFDNIDLFDDDGGAEAASVVKTESAPAPQEKQDDKRAALEEIDVVQLEMQILSTPSIYQKLATLIDTRQKYWVGRSYFMLSLGLKMNAMVGNVVDPLDLANALYLHDFPMVSLSDDILYGVDLSDADFDKIKQHPLQAYEMAQVLGASEECQKMVYQHHERPDGNGYPNQLKSSEICHGAKIIAICDAYFSMTNIKAHRATKRSALRTVAEINACAGTQFDSAWVKVFNLVVKRHKMLENI